MQLSSTTCMLARIDLLRSYVTGKTEADLDDVAHVLNTCRNTASRVLRAIGWSVVERRHQFGEARTIYAGLLYALADRDGVITFGTVVPDGLIAVACGTPSKVRNLIDATARHAYDGKTLLVPGVPEAADDDAALDALIAWRDWIGERR